MCVGRSSFSSRTGKADSPLELLSSIPMDSQLTVWEHQAARFAVENKDFQRTEQIARKAVKPTPKISKSESG